MRHDHCQDVGLGDFGQALRKGWVVAAGDEILHPLEQEFRRDGRVARGLPVSL
jgi:hypothetical protein